MSGADDRGTIEPPALPTEATSTDTRVRPARRLGAWLIDLAIGTFLGILAGALAISVGIITGDVSWVIIPALMLAVWYAYLVLTESVWHATPGGLMLELIVLHTDGTPCSPVSAVIRNLTKALLTPQAVLLTTVAVMVTHDGASAFSLALRVCLAGLCVDGLIILRSPSRRSVGDRIAGTVVARRDWATRVSERRASLAAPAEPAGRTSTGSGSAKARSGRRLVTMGAVLTLCVLVLAVGITRPGCGSRTDLSDPGPLPSRGVAHANTAQARALAKPLSNFGFGLLLRQAKATDGNVVLSPLSLACMLSMIGTGAEGQTKQELSRALGVSGLDPAAVNQGWADLLTAAQSGKHARVTVCNSLWLRHGIPFKTAFLTTDRDYYASDCLPLASDDKVALEQINHWVSKRTSGKIPELFRSGRLDPWTYLVAINTVNLKVGWDLFKPKDTALAPFTLADGTRTPVEMMHGTVHNKPDGVRAVVRRDFAAVCLKTDGPVDVWVAVPTGRRTPEDIVRTLAKRGGVPMLYGASSLYPTVYTDLPRFAFSSHPSDSDLKRDLEAMGVRRLFDSRLADLDGIAVTPGPFYVTRIAHQARIQVDEKGVQAQAASGGMAGCGAGGPLTISADRPFLVVLAESGSRAPLFLAIVRDPRP